MESKEWIGASGKSSQDMFKKLSYRKRKMKKMELENLVVPGLSALKQVTLYKGYKTLVDEQGRKETCPLPPLETWLQARKKIR